MSSNVPRSGLSLPGPQEPGHAWTSGTALCGYFPLLPLRLPVVSPLPFLPRCRWSHLQVNWNSWRRIISFLLLLHICLDFFFFFTSNIIYS